MIIAEISKAQKFLNTLLAIVVCHSVKSAIFIDFLFFNRLGKCYGQVYYLHAEYIILWLCTGYMPHFFG
ncbi:hypothetical protein T636_A0651 [Enterobacter hormaechei subsp. xiangfangensis]|nr:hypothetical protein T636_A0651 [Enterobacter hormaechei subsp. xiangfangensis]RAL72957.1 putative membrane protein [Enterobacter hormaechei]